MANHMLVQQVYVELVKYQDKEDLSPFRIPFDFLSYVEASST
jgi:hypothetical protein